MWSVVQFRFRFFFSDNTHFSSHSRKNSQSQVVDANLSVGENITAAIADAGAAASAGITPGLLLAYGAMLVMALFPIIVGSISSVRRAREGQFLGENSMSKKDAAMFPLQASMALLGLYLLFKVGDVLCM